MIKLIAMRLTALDSGHRQADRHALQQSLTRMRAHRTQLVLLTRAAYPALLRRFQSVQGPLDYVAENGAEVVANGVNIRERLLSAVLLGQLLDWLRRSPEFQAARLTLSSRARTMTNVTPDDPLYPALHRAYPTMKTVPDLLMVASQVYQIRVDLPQPGTKRHRQLLRQRFQKRIRIVPQGRSTFYLLAPEADWASGVAALQKHGGIRNRQTAAFGRTHADFAYLNLAKYRFAPQEAELVRQGLCRPLVVQSGRIPPAIWQQVKRLLKQK